MNAQFDAINEAVNRLPYKSDAARYGEPDFWTAIDQDGGDCDDYAVGKLRRLMADGWPIEKLRLACCYVETGDYHAVLIASDDDGDWMLDNRQPRPVPVDDIKDLGYRPDRIQSEGGSRTWVQWLCSEERPPVRHGHPAAAKRPAPQT